MAQDWYSALRLNTCWRDAPNQLCFNLEPFGRYTATCCEQEYRYVSQLSCKSQEGYRCLHCRRADGQLLAIIFRNRLHIYPLPSPRNGLLTYSFTACIFIVITSLAQQTNFSTLIRRHHYGIYYGACHRHQHRLLCNEHHSHRHAYLQNMAKDTIASVT